jgi:hypothetical protein
LTTYELARAEGLLAQRQDEAAAAALTIAAQVEPAVQFSVMEVVAAATVRDVWRPTPTVNLPGVGADSGGVSTSYGPGEHAEAERAVRELERARRLGVELPGEPLAWVKLAEAAGGGTKPLTMTFDALGAAAKVDPYLAQYQTEEFVGGYLGPLWQDLTPAEVITVTQAVTELVAASAGPGAAVRACADLAGYAGNAARVGDLREATCRATQAQAPELTAGKRGDGPPLRAELGGWYYAS